MKAKPIAAISAALFILSVLLYIAVMIFTVYGAMLYSAVQNLIFTDSFELISIMCIYSVIASIYVLRAGTDTRKLRRALIIEAFYLVALIFSFDKIAMASGALCIYLYGGDVVPISWSIFLPIMTFVPCILSMIFETLAYKLSRKQMKTTNSH